MFTKRIIPCLDVHNGRVVKGVNFVNLKDAGDPVEIAAAYDKAGADELVFLDITASSDAQKYCSRYWFAVWLKMYSFLLQSAAVSVQSRISVRCCARAQIRFLLILRPLIRPELISVKRQTSLAASVLLSLLMPNDGPTAADGISIKTADGLIQGWML